MHKLCTSKPQVPKSLIKMNPKVEEQLSYSSDEEDNESETSSIEIITRKRKTINECDCFYWQDEFDEILEGTHAEVFYECSPFNQVKQWDCSNDNQNYNVKYKILSAFMDNKSNIIRSFTRHADCKNTGLTRSKSLYQRENNHNIKEGKRRKLHKAYSMEPKRVSDKSEDVNNYIFTEYEEVIVHEPIYPKPSYDLIGYIDKYGFFIIDLNSEGIDLHSISITDDAGFFDKIIIESNYKAWLSNIKQTFEIFKTIYTKIFMNSRFRPILLDENFEYFKDADAFNDYFSKINITCFNNPIVANQ